MAAGNATDENLLGRANLGENVYVLEVLNLIELLRTEALEAADGDEDDDEEELTAD